MPISARLICNKVSYQFDYEEISAVRDALARVVSGEITAQDIRLEH